MPVASLLAGDRRGEKGEMDVFRSDAVSLRPVGRQDRYGVIACNEAGSELFNYAAGSHATAPFSCLP